MTKHQNKVIRETFDLFEKSIKLESFIKSPVFETLDPEEKKLLTDQLECMKKYYAILRDRIYIFK